MPVLQALLAAATFGLSAPLAKRLLDAASPLFLAGLLYLGAGVFLTAVNVSTSQRLLSARTARDGLYAKNSAPAPRNGSK